MGLCDAAQRVTSNRDQPLPVFGTGGGNQSLREQYVALDRAAHRGNAVDLIHGRPNDGEVQPLEATDIAIEDVANVQAEIDLRYWQSRFTAAQIECGDAVANGKGGAEWEAAPISLSWKIASVPSPINFRTSPPAAWIADITTSA